MRYSVALLSLLMTVSIGGCAANGATIDVEEFDEEFAAFKDVVLEHEEAIASCMSDQGFTYVVALPPDVALEEAALRARHEGQDPHAAVEAMDEPEDPIDELLAEMSAAERDAWQQAYWGNEDPSSDDPGCYYATYEEIWGIDPMTAEDPAADVVAEIKADPRVVEAEDGYISCMREHGYEVSDTHSSIHDWIAERRAEESASSGDEGPAPTWEEAARDRHRRCVASYNDVYNDVYLDYFSEVPGYGPPEDG